MRAPEEHRLLQIVGDVGVGKTTFLKHLEAVHLPTEKFYGAKPIYLDWKGFTASLNDPLPHIYSRFTQHVFSGIEGILSEEEIKQLDHELFSTADIFAISRSALIHEPEGEVERQRSRQIVKVLDQNPVEFAFARLNQMCKADRNAVILVFDNIDQIHSEVLDHLLQFCIEVQSKTIPLTVIALRDHTEAGSRSCFSQYSRTAVAASWRMRLYAPDIRKLLLRRLEWFFPQNEADFPVEIPAGPFKQRVSTEKSRRICKNLLLALLQQPKTLYFMTVWCNYNIRRLFNVIHDVLKFHGLKKYDANVVKGEQISLSVDQCITAIALGRHALFYPEQSDMINLYSIVGSIDPTSPLVGARILQYLGRRMETEAYCNLLSRFVKWGYPEATVEAQLDKMIAKDVIWTDAGDPKDVDRKNSNLRVSYRGKYYLEKLLRRTTYNYIMAFDVDAPTDDHALVRDYKSEFLKEIMSFSDFGAVVDSDAICGRVLALVDVVAVAEQTEYERIKERHLEADFDQEFGFNSVSVQIVDGLHAFISKILVRGQVGRSVSDPSSSILREVEALRNKLKQRR